MAVITSEKAVEARSPLVIPFPKIFVPSWVDLRMENQPVTRSNAGGSRSLSVFADWMRRLLATAAIAGMSIVATLIWQSIRHRPTVPLTASLGGEWSKISTEMDERVKAMFPIGTPVADMGIELKREGFSRVDWSSSPGEEHRAMRREDSFPCNIGAYVYWRDDGKGGLATVRGSINEEGCL